MTKNSAFIYDPKLRVVFKPLSFDKYSFMPANNDPILFSFFHNLLSKHQNKNFRKRILKCLSAKNLFIIDNSSGEIVGVLSYNVKKSLPDEVCDLFGVNKNAKNVKLYLIAVKEMEPSNLEPVVKDVISVLENYNPNIIWLRMIFSETPLSDAMIRCGFIKKDDVTAYIF
ncbi:MAG: hypothetical protein ABIK73_07695 [candidate division WOR-3 bacterium]